MSLALIASLIGMFGVGWAVKTLHLKTTQLKALDKLLKMPDGALEALFNKAVEKAAADAASKIVK